jgi:hypothetical protein
MQQRPDDSRFGDEHTALMLMFVRVRVWMRVFFGGKQPLGTFRAREEKIPYGGGHVRCVRVRKIPSQYSLNTHVTTASILLHKLLLRDFSERRSSPSRSTSRDAGRH